jgi:hypothetical protein
MVCLMSTLAISLVNWKKGLIIGAGLGDLDIDLEMIIINSSVRGIYSLNSLKALTNMRVGNFIDKSVGAFRI